MGDEHHGAPLALPELLQLLVKPVAGDLIERAEGLVHHQNTRLKGQRPRNRCALLHATGQLPWKLALKAREADALQVLAGNPVAISGALALDLQRQFDIAQHRAPGKQRRGLKHIAVSPRQPRFVGRDTVDQHAAAGDVFQVRDDPQQRGFAAARGADERYKFTRLNRQVNIGQRVYGGGVGVVNQRGFTDFNGKRSAGCGWGHVG